MEENVLTLDQVSFQYQDDHAWVLDGINIILRPGDKVGMVGDNGCGKSTITKLILGIEKPIKGEVKLCNEVVSWSRHYPEVGYIGDPGYSSEMLGLPVSVTVKTLVEVVEQIYGEGVRELITLLDIESLYGKENQNLSTGERKRVMALLALSKPNRLLILDEPFDGLDKHYREVMFILLQRYLTPEVSLLFIGHSRIEIDLFTDKVFRIIKGKLVPEAQNKFSVTVSSKSQEPLVSIKKSGVFQYELNRMLESKEVESEISFSLIQIDETKEI
ncbi:MAG: ATP-binding cassette domain-containing protein [Leadbetterella sp.]|nr:ATP-binding cassette domain-containing protein [Leadbetterella sp.]